MSRPVILLSFDVEEFDMPLEYGQTIDMEEQMRVGHEGLQALMRIMNSYPSVRCTYFTTANFAQHFPADIKAIAANNEVASHTFYHTHFDVSDLLASREALEAITGKVVSGLRMPRMRPVEMGDVLAAGYRYDSSVNPCWIPGRYDNRHLPRNPYVQEGVLRFPASVTPRFRVPLFWLSFKNFPEALFKKLLRDTLKKDGYACLYFHPWEFIDLKGYNIPGYAKRHAGAVLQQRLRTLIETFLPTCDFVTMEEYIERGLRS
jgi:peptidoglycan/xylan/chitin deacetylase (PgdA/CDA1 family)